MGFLFTAAMLMALTNVLVAGSQCIKYSTSEYQLAAVPSEPIV